MRHLVTGGSGYLGNLIARRLIEQGEQVRILDIWEDVSRPRNTEFVKCDILDREGVRRAMQGIDVVHNNVALVPLSRAEGRFRAVNVDGTRIAAEEAARAGVKWFVHMSSSAVFEVPDSGPIGETTPLRPREEYGQTKLESEHAARTACGSAGVPLIIIRPRTLLGPGRLGLFNLLFSWISEGRDIYVLGSGDNLFQFVHPLDLIDFYMLALGQGKPGIYNVGTMRFGTLRDALETLIRHAGTRTRVRSLPRLTSVQLLRALYHLGLSPLVPYHYTHYHRSVFFDIEPLLKLGWSPKFSNDDMFRESYDWFIANRTRTVTVNGVSPHRRPLAERALWLLRKIS